MKKIGLILFSIIITLIIINFNIVTQNILLSFNICINNLFPSLIPFMILSNILIKYDFIEEIANILESFCSKLLKVNKYCSFAIVMSMLSGTPSNGKYLKELYDNKLIDEKDINTCIKFCHFTNPLFILNMIGLTFLNNKKIGLIILISHFISSFILAIIYRNNKVNNKMGIKRYNFKQKNNFLLILNNSIIDTSNTLLLILGIITFCLIITGLIDSVFNINNNLKFIYGIIEMTQGLKYLSLSNYNIYIKACISCFLISFGGICIHAQVFSILDNKKIRYLPYLFSRILHALLASIICYIIMLYY